MRQDCRGLILIFDKVEEGVVGEGLSQYLYLLMFMNLRPGHLKNQLESINIKVDKDNGKSVGMVKGRARKFWRFSRNEFWKNIGCLVSAPNFGLGGVEDVGEVRGSKDKQKEDEEKFNQDEG